MGDLAADTAVEQIGDGRYTADLVDDWEIWGPNGGYLASIALRAAGAASSQPRPASIAVHYLGVARFEPVELTVTSLRRSKRIDLLRVVMAQDGASVIEATVWAVAEGLEPLEHDHAPLPMVPRPEDLPSMEERAARAGLLPPPFRFWDNIDQRAVRWQADWPPAGPLAPENGWWCRYRPAATFEDRWVDACRTLLLLDTFGWPAASGAHAWRIGGAGELTFIAPTIDLHVTFNRFAPAEPWLYVHADSPAGAEGVLNARTAVWSAGGELLGTGAQTMLARRVAPDRA